MDERKRALFRGDESFAWELFERAPAVRFAAATGGKAICRTLHAVVLDGRLCFHGGDEGEKLALLDGEVVASCEELVTEVPSYWIHPELACPATTYYQSAIAEGRVERVEEPARKAKVLGALMDRFQPEGGYAPITAEDVRYRKVLETLLVAEFVPTRFVAKRKLGQHRSVAQIERVLEGLFERGGPGDLAAMRMIIEAHPERLKPTFLRGPCDTLLCVAPDEDDARAVAALLEGQYWTTPFPSERLARAQLGSTAWIVARDAQGRVVGSARAVSDGARYAYVMDVVVQPSLQRRGLASALMALLTRHPRVRDAAAVALRTRDAQGLYQKLGFLPRSAVDEELVLLRGPLSPV
jgi:GNAT superfamily N-acetyltransferase/nitroimidazol reductase NimA-like FMN-containing flavoprotein (pyridoxamine 5'-phosphate oxidase superfamily)